MAIDGGSGFGAAVKAALADSGVAEKLAASIDCLLSTRLFHDSGLPHDFGSPENHPEAVATASGLNPETLLYGDVGGQSPQKHLNKLACEVHDGKIQGGGDRQCRECRDREARAAQRTGTGLEPARHPRDDRPAHR